MQDYESKHSGEEIDAILDAVANKVDKVEGKGLSTEDFTTALKNRLESLRNYDDTSIREVVENIIELIDDFNQDIAELYRIKQNTCYILPFDLVALKRVVLGEIDAVAFTPDIFNAIQKNTLILLPKVIDETNGYQVVTQANYYADDVEMYLTIVDDEYDIHISGIFNDGNYLITSSNIVLIPKQKPITDLDAIREGSAKGKTSVQGVFVNNKQLTPDIRGNISLPAIPTKNDIANMGFTQNKGTVTGVMVNGESKSPNSEGVVDLGEIKVDEVKFANDLTGVVEATPEMFTYRPSAGDKSVRDESAVIRRIKGNTSVWGQYVRNGNFTEGTRYSAGVNTILFNNGDGSINIVNNGSGSDGISQSFVSPIPTKHKVLIVMDYKRSSTAVSNVVFYLTKSGSGIYDKSYIYNVSSDSRRVDSAILETTNDTDLISVYPFIKGVAGEYVTMYSYMAIDLTAIFGAGYEPTTYEEFRQYYPDAYYPYCAPEIRSMRTTGIETVGFNQWDEEWENGTFNTETGENISNNQIRCKNLIRIFPNTYYSLSIGDKNLGIWAMFYDENLNILQPVNLNSSVSRKCLYISPSGDRNVFLTPENASWMKFYIPAEYGSTTYKGDICINLSHSGVRNGEYKSYEKNTLLLPEIAKYFPNGMHGIGDVYDEINEEMAIQRFGVVDLGTLTWNAASTDTSDIYRWQSEAINRPTQATNEFPNIVCLKYTTGTNGNTYIKVDCISVSASGSIRIFDSNYTTRDDKDAFVASLQGVKLYYELAEPIYTTIDEPLQLAYKVDDFGTERMLSNAPSAPFKADIVYQFNAEGRIRDNSRNIEKLEELVKQPSDWLEENPDSPAFIKNKPTMPTQVATATEVIAVFGIPTQMLPNVVYEVRVSIENFTFPQLVAGEENVSNVWKLIAYMLQGTAISYPSTIKWRDGIPPTIDAAAFVEFTFTSITGRTDILGEWKLYK